jgi:hypothetical protein
MGRSEIFNASAPESAVAASLKANPGRLAGRVNQEDLDVALANGQFGGDVKEIHRASNETSIREQSNPGARGGAAFNYPASPGTTSTNIPINVVSPPRWKAAGFSSQEEHDKELHEVYSTELTKEIGGRASKLQADAAEDAETEKLAKRAAASKPKEEVAQTSNTVSKPLPEADLYASARRGGAPKVEEDEDTDVDVDDSMNETPDVLDAEDSPIIKKPRKQSTADSLPRFPHGNDTTLSKLPLSEVFPSTESASRRKDMETVRQSSEEASSAAETSRMAAQVREQQAARGGKTTEVSAQSPSEREALREKYASGKTTFDNPREAREQAPDEDWLASLTEAKVKGRKESKKEKVLEISSRERRWPSQLDVNLADVPRPTGLSSDNSGTYMVRPSSTPEEALTIARTKGGEGTAAQVEQDTTREDLKAERDAYKSSRQEELMKEHKNEDGTWKDTAEAHSAETEKQLAAYKTKLGNISNKKARRGDESTTLGSTVKESDNTPTGNTRAALEGLMNDWRAAKASGDTKGMERAKRAHSRVSVSEGSDAVKAQMCYGDNCTNEVSGDEPNFTVNKGKIITTSKPSGDGVTCEDCAAKEANARHSELFGTPVSRALKGL